MPIQADKHVKTATIFPIKKNVQKPADWMYTTIIIQICLGTIRDWLPATYGFSRGLLNMFSPHQWIFETDASCCSPNKRTDGSESCCWYTRDPICMQICIAVYTDSTASLFPSTFLLQCTIKISKSPALFLLPAAGISTKHETLPVTSSLTSSPKLKSSP